jgi:hypothetical protein
MNGQDLIGSSTGRFCDEAAGRRMRQWTSIPAAAE